MAYYHLCWFVVCIPTYLHLIRPHISFYIPGMLKKIGLGIILLIVSLVTTLAMDVIVHTVKADTQCMFSGLTRDRGYTFYWKVTTRYYSNIK